MVAKGGFGAGNSSETVPWRASDLGRVADQFCGLVPDARPVAACGPGQPSRGLLEGQTAAPLLFCWHALAAPRTSVMCSTAGPLARAPLPLAALPALAPLAGAAHLGTCMPSSAWRIAVPQAGVSSVTV